MTRLLLIPLLSLISFCLHGQELTDRSFLGKKYKLERLGNITTQSTLVPGIPMGRPVLSGNGLMHTAYRPAIFRLRDGSTTAEFPAKYHVYLHEFYIWTDQGIRVLGADDVNSFVWRRDTLARETETFINANDFQTDKADSVRGFFHVLSDGALPLVKLTRTKILDPTFNLALNVGREDYTFSTTTKLYYLKDNVAKALPPPRKIGGIFDKHAGEIKKFIDNNRLDMNNEIHLIEVFNYYNLLSNRQ